MSCEHHNKDNSNSRESMMMMEEAELVTEEYDTTKEPTSAHGAAAALEEGFSSNNSSSDRYNNRSSPPLDESSDIGAEHFVRAGAQTVRFVRCILITLLGLAAALSGLFTFRLSSRIRNDAFIRDFQDAAEGFISAFQLGTANQLYQTSTLSVAMSSGLYDRILQPNFPFVTVKDIDYITASLHLQAQADNVAWSPLLRNETQKLEWEAYARNQPNVTGGADWTIADGIYQVENGTAVPADNGQGLFSPIWQISPSVENRAAIMFDQMSTPPRRDAILELLQTGAPALSATIDPSTDDLFQYADITGSTSGVLAIFFYPVFGSLDSPNIVGSLHVAFSWTALFQRRLPPRSDGAVVVLENTCGQVFTFKTIGKEIHFMGIDDLHDTNFDSLEVTSAYGDFRRILLDTAPRQSQLQNTSTYEGCSYFVRIYPSESFQLRYHSNEPWQVATVVVLVIIFTSCAFFAYDVIVRRIQAKVLRSARRSEAIVSSLFPAVVRERLFRDNNDTAQGSRTVALPTQRRMNLGHGLTNHKALLRSYLSNSPSVDVSTDPEPIADLFPNTTIMFADIAGFTAWSSEREPSKVFKLLETLYGAFDQAAKKLGVFKVETIGDCYVAVSGLPEPRRDHVIVMVKFAYECMIVAHDLTRRLESSLGPGTADLAIRFGLHSGPVIAGVLRGERARFQLFGDTMNVASRMESTVSQIHISKETAQLLVNPGKQDWVELRRELVTIKGKGQLQTYWVKPSKRLKRNSADGTNKQLSDGILLPDPVSNATKYIDETSIWGATNLDTALLLRTEPYDRDNRLVDWNAELLQQFLQKIVAWRNVSSKRSTRHGLHSLLHESGGECDFDVHVVDEIAEVIPMPIFNEKATREETDPSIVDLGPAIRSQIWEFVFQIASLYRDNGFHNFEHASHVAMSASKLLKRIIAPDVEFRADGAGKKLKSRTTLSKEIHESTFGISSDPLMQFAVLFSALIHDTDHSGLPNNLLVQSNDPLAIKYRNKCIAEQHSVQVAWEVLMDDRFTDFRRCIYQNEEERVRFRQLVINAVIATDIADPELQAWRRQRWDKAFPDKDQSLDSHGTTDLKATIVYEYIIQASDVAHTMQHWHVYQKWSEHLFHEKYNAFAEGKDDENPLDIWFEGELRFFDNYVIPLAKNLKECNVFGVSCDEYLSYALENRSEWELKGKRVVEDWSLNIVNGLPNQSASTAVDALASIRIKSYLSDA